MIYGVILACDLLVEHQADLCAGLNGSVPRRNIPMDEVKQHNTRDDCWLIYGGKVGVMRLQPSHLSLAL